MWKTTSWPKAIQKVLEEAGRPLHPVDIADEIARRDLLKNRGTAPAAAVARTIITSMYKQGAKSPFVKVSPVDFALRSQKLKSTWFVVGFEPGLKELELQRQSTGYLNAYGMFWERSDVKWAERPRLLGEQEAGTIKVDFCKQLGIYLLHDQQGVVYVGRTTHRNLGDRLLEHHARDRLRGRWTRFSWFGIYPVQDNGALEEDADLSHLNITDLIVTMEAMLI